MTANEIIALAAGLIVMGTLVVLGVVFYDKW